MTQRSITLVDVGPRDGFQSIGPIIPTKRKLAILQGLYDAGVRRVEATAFVSERAVPQLADAVEVLAFAKALHGMDAQVLVPSKRHAERAIAAGADHIAFVLSVSEKHNMGNVRRTPGESVEEYRGIVAGLGDSVRIRLNVATAFDCPFDGAMDPDRTLELLDQLVDIAPDAEICLCDTTGRVTPDLVAALFVDARARFPQAANWAYHGHDTYGLGLTNVAAAYAGGIHVIDASIGGLGGCPFAPGATGNVASEDVIWMFGHMGIDTGIDLERLLPVAIEAAALPGGLAGGRVRDALAARACLPGETVPAVAA
jgi:hydroxymethylglutaryl-CoA lyase